MLDARSGTTIPPVNSGSAVPLLLARHGAGEPIVVAVEGRSLEIRDDESFRRLLILVDRVETIEALREGLGSLDRGEGRPVGEFFEELDGEDGPVDG
jgi:hypothetical protein